MKITILPDVLNLNVSQHVQLYRYKTTEDIQKTKIILSKNTISFLKHGVKAVFGDDKNININKLVYTYIFISNLINK